jgi:hypothetical protein
MQSPTARNLLKAKINGKLIGNCIGI